MYRILWVQQTSQYSTMKNSTDVIFAFKTRAFKSSESVQVKKNIGEN